jgi:hypothetical protein
MSRIGSVLLSDYKRIFFAYCLLFLVLMCPFFVGQVVAPHRQYQELGASEANVSSGLTENRKFSDFSNAYIPEVHQNLAGARSGWLNLWTNGNELGRPTYHISGFSPAYLPSWIVSRLTHDPWRFMTILSLGVCFGAGAFVILFCMEIGLSPLAGLIGGIGLASSPLFMYWLTFPMFPAVWCWSAGALWGATRIARKPDLASWGVLAFSAYSLLMAAYPQPVVFQAYLLGGYGLYLALRKLRRGWLEAGRFCAICVSALIVGAALTLPVYIDLAHISAESARVAPPASFFTAILPKMGSLTDALRFFVLGTMPQLFGNPVATSYPFQYDGLSVTPMVIFFAVIGMFCSARETWGWWMAIGMLCLLAFVHPLYVLGVEYLGFNLSRSTPLGSILLPLTIIVAYGVDALVVRADSRLISWVVLTAAGVVAGAIVVALAFGLTQAAPVHWGAVLVMSVLVPMFVIQQRRTHPNLLIAAVVIIMAAISYPLMLRQNLAQIATTSPLVQKVRANLPAGSRFAVAAPGLSVLPPNLNAELGLPSVHSYNSLSSRRYQVLIEALGSNVQTYGRWNGSISPDYDGAMFWMSNISLILSPKKLSSGNLEYLGEESGVHLYKVISRMGDSLQVVRPWTKAKTGGLHIADPRLLPSHMPSELLNEGDLLEFSVASGAPSVLVLSQKYHRDWDAQVFTGSGWTPTETTAVNGVFQGVLLPGDAQRVRLEFRPYARYAWIAHVFWLFLLALLGLTTWRKRRHAGAGGVSTE